MFYPIHAILGASKGVKTPVDFKTGVHSIGRVRPLRRGRSRQTLLISPSISNSPPTVNADDGTSRPGIQIARRRVRICFKGSRDRPWTHSIDTNATRNQFARNGAHLTRENARAPIWERPAQEEAPQNSILARNSITRGPFVVPLVPKPLFSTLPPP